MSKCFQFLFFTFHSWEYILKVHRSKHLLKKRTRGKRLLQNIQYIHHMTNSQKTLSTMCQNRTQRHVLFQHNYAILFSSKNYLTQTTIISAEYSKATVFQNRTRGTYLFQHIICDTISASLLYKDTTKYLNTHCTVIASKSGKSLKQKICQNCSGQETRETA